MLLNFVNRQEINKKKERNKTNKKVIHRSDTQIIVKTDIGQFNPAIGGTFLCLLMPVPSRDKWGGLRQERHPA